MATERYEARTAPAGLALVQDLVNTHTVQRGGTDLLPDRGSAEAWLRTAAGEWARSRGLEAPELSLTEADVAALRALRDVVQELLAVPAGQRPVQGIDTPVGTRRRTQVGVVSDDEGRVGMAPVGTGAGWLESAVWSEILLAQQNGEWSRLKLCREPGCRSAFYDTSRNGSGVWHNVRSCGNIANLRASRTRMEVRAAADGDATGEGLDG
jgi:predicted RNA-binding Zn ribbon-like protein